MSANKPKKHRKPGAGRPKGSKTKATAALRAHVVKLMESGDEMPLDFLLRTMRMAEPTRRLDESGLGFVARYQAWDRRTLAAAQAAAPFCHARLANVEHTGKDGGPIHHHLTVEFVE
jgi:hypothetical protein